MSNSCSFANCGTASQAGIQAGLNYTPACVGLITILCLIYRTQPYKELIESSHL